MKPLICRQWTGAVPKALGEEYQEYLLKTGLADYQSTEGNRGALLLKRSVPGAVEFQTLSLWEGIEAIRAFAGDDYNRAVYYPEDSDFLLRKSRLVSHFDVVFGSVSRELSR